MSVLFSDNFDRANSTDVGNGWTTLPYSGATLYGIIDNMCQIATTSTIVRRMGVHRSVVENERAVSCKVVGTPGNIHLLLGRSDAPTSGLFSTTGNAYRLYITPTTFYLQRYDSGVATQIATGPVALQSGDTVKVERSGNQIICSRNGIALATVTDSTYLAGLPYVAVNLETKNIASYYAIDDFAIEVPSDAPAHNHNAIAFGAGF